MGGFDKGDRFGGTEWHKRLGEEEVFAFTDEVGELMHADSGESCECDRSKFAEYYRDTHSRRLVVTVCHGCNNMVRAEIV